MKTVTSILQANELLDVSSKINFLLFDVSNEKNARNLFEESHLDGAQFVDLNTQLAEIPNDFKHGGRHPLPSIESFAETLSILGVSNESHIVLYDRANGANAAARFWWMLKAAGIETVQVLDGGFQAAVNAGFKTETGKSNSKEKSIFKFEKWNLPTVKMNEVRSASEQNKAIIDVRAPERFNGIHEPIDLVAGHIPNAINIPLTLSLDENGHFLSPEKLKMHFLEKVGNLDSENWIVHCGSGVTACHTILACNYAGLKTPKLYVGSWSEWSRHF
jgi:thiosulfate/3-mercaptopyruvate sulfurtransferase